jgi:RNA polymerase sigma-70 factor (ECF subfamily)
VPQATDPSLVGRTVDDLDLLRRCVAGEPAAWDALVRDHASMLHRAAARVLGRAPGGPTDAEAEDVVQAVFLKLWDDGRRRLRTFQGRSRLSTWLVAITQREALDRLRLRSRTGAAAPVPVPVDADVLDGCSRLGPEVWNGHAPPPEATAEVREAKAAVAAAVARLPARDRLLVRLVYFDGRSYDDVARVLSVSANSISPWLYRARERLKADLDPGTGVRKGPSDPSNGRLERR